MTVLLKKKIVQESGEVTKSPKEATLVITGKSNVKDEAEKPFGLTKSFLKNTLIKPLHAVFCITTGYQTA